MATPCPRIYVFPGMRRFFKIGRGFTALMGLALLLGVAGCATSGYVETGPDWWGPDYYGPGFYGDWGPDVYVFGHGRDHFHDHAFAHRGFQSRGVAGFHGGGGDKILDDSNFEAFPLGSEFDIRHFEQFPSLPQA